MWNGNVAVHSYDTLKTQPLLLSFSEKVKSQQQSIGKPRAVETHVSESVDWWRLWVAV